MMRQWFNIFCAIEGHEFIRKGGKVFCRNCGKTIK